MRLLAPALACLALTVSGLAVAATPAYAEGEPVISDIDVSTPGHAIGTVTSGAPYVAVGLRANGSGSDLGSPTFIATVGGSAAFNEETWGLTSGVISARACSTQELASCGTTVLSQSFTPLDVAPVITWPEDTTIGTGQEYAVTVSDTTGGGRLAAVWDPVGGYTFERTFLDVPGPTVLPLGEDGADEIIVTRCHSTDSSICRSTGVTRQVTVNRFLPSGFALTNDQYAPISPTIGTKLELSIHVYEEGPITLEWHLTRISDDGVVGGIGGELTGLTPDADGNLFPELDLTGLGDGSYRLVSRVHRDTADFGRVSGEIWRSPSFDVDGTAPVIASAVSSATTLYPAKDGYRDTVKVTVKTANRHHNDMATLKVVSVSTGATIRTLNPYNNIYGYQFLWNGRAPGGIPVPAGKYKLVAMVDDWAQNHDEQLAGTVTVIRKKIVAHTFRQTVTAAGSKVDQHVGRCSTLRKPSLRGWAGSLGYYTNTKCRRTFDASLVLTVHALRTPRGVARYRDFYVSSYGGAARAEPRSLAYLDYLNRSRNWVSGMQMTPGLTTRQGLTRDGSKFVFDDRYVLWRVYTAKGAKYDIKNFSVTLKYDTLVPE